MEEAKRYKTEAAQRDAFVKICHDEDAVELRNAPCANTGNKRTVGQRVRERAAIAVSAEYLLGLADDIVDIYKLGGGRIDIKKEPFFAV